MSNLPTEADLFPAAQAQSTTPESSQLPTESDLFPSPAASSGPDLTPVANAMQGLGEGVLSAGQGLVTAPARAMDLFGEIATGGHAERMRPPGAMTATQEAEQFLGKPPNPAIASAAASLPMNAVLPHLPLKNPVTDWLVNDVLSNAGMSAATTAADAAAQGKHASGQELAE